MAEKCTNPQMEFLLLKEVAISNAEKRSVRLSPELERHLAECPRCRAMLPEWAERLAAWKQPPETETPGTKQ